MDSLYKVPDLRIIGMHFTKAIFHHVMNKINKHPFQSHKKHIPYIVGLLMKLTYRIRVRIIMDL